jgi:hypothetical protein
MASRKKSGVAAKTIFPIRYSLLAIRPLYFGKRPIR